MIELKGVITAENTLEANLGLGVDYYKGEKGNDGRDGVDGKDGINGKDGTDQVYIGATPPADEKVKLWVDTSTQTTNPIEWDDVLNKPDIPSEYIKDAIVSNNKLTLTKQDDTNVVFTPSGGSGGDVSGYAFTSSQTFTNEDKLHLKEIYNNKNIYMTIDNLTVIRIMSLGSKKGFAVVNTNGATSNQVLVYTVNFDSSGNISSDNFTLFMSYYLVGNSSALSGDIITNENWTLYIPVSEGGWSGPTVDKSMSDLYNIKQLWVIYQNNSGIIMNSILRFDYDDITATLGSKANTDFYLHHDDVSSNQVYINYDGTNLNVYGGAILGYFYKT